MNYEKAQTSIAIIKTPQRSYNMLLISLHVPNRLSTYEKETWILTILENIQKRYGLPMIAHVDMNAKLNSMKLLSQYLNLKGWNKFQDDKYSWRKGATTANNDIVI